MELRKYSGSEMKDITELFYQTVHTVNAADYNREQLDAWASGDVDAAEWDRSFREHVTYVAVDQTLGAEVITGFADMDRSGYLDRLYVHRDYLRQGIASALCSRLEEEVGSDRYITHASITARIFFEKRGYRVVKEQQVERNGVWLKNYVMEKRKC